MNTSSVWEMLRGVVGEQAAAAAEGIVKVQRVCQWDGAVRYDLYVHPEWADRVVKGIQRHRSSLSQHLYVREHRQPKDRGGLKRRSGEPAGWEAEPGDGSGEHSGRQQQQQSGTARVEIKLASWNINGLKAKRADVEYFLEEVKPHVLGLQETHRPKGSWPLRFSGHQCVERQCVERATPDTVMGHAEGGLAMVTEATVIANEVGGAPTPHWVMSRVNVEGVQRKLMVGTVYVTPKQSPHPETGGAEVMEALSRYLMQQVQKEPDTDVVVMGDFNMKPDRLRRWLKRKRLPMGIVPVRGSAMTRHLRGGKATSAIDHVIATRPILREGAWVRVIRSWDCSDHWPIVCSIPLEAKQTAKEGGDPSQQKQRAQNRRRIDRTLLQGAVAAQIAHHNMWEPLLEELADEGTPADKAAERMAEVTWEVAEACGAVIHSHEQGKQEVKYHTLRVRTKRAIDKRRRLAARLMDMAEAGEQGIRGDAQAAAALWAEYHEARHQATHMARTDRMKAWYESIAKNAAKVRTGDPSGYWRWIKWVTGRGKTGTQRTVQPVFDPTLQKVVYEPTEIGAAWGGHFARLAADTGHSKDPEHWAGMGGPELPELEGINQAPTWAEIATVIRKAAKGKAPGQDGIPIELYKTEILVADRLAKGAKAARQPAPPGDAPATPMGKALMQLIQKCWEEERVPECWDTASVVAIPKKGGDPLSMDSSRGISLITVAMKLLTVALARRLSDALESSGRLRKEQGGFRPAEECVAQATALYEVLRRRRIAGKRTYAAFIDFKKAYDRVPHEALLRKLHLIGVRGKMLSYIKEMYAHSYITVIGAFGESPKVPLLTGLRQGCPMSPVMFDVFINDIVEALEPYGCTVPGLLGTRQERKIPCLLFADDLVSLHSNRSKLRKAIQAIEQWAGTWGMSCGADKCGVFEVDPGDKTLEEKAPWTVHGEKIPIVPEYCYLGCTIRNDLDVNKIAEVRAKKAEAALNALGPFLRSKSIPLQTKSLAVKAILLPMMLFGAELWGMNQQTCAKAESLLMRALRWSIGASGKGGGGISSMALLTELGTETVHAMASARRARAWGKFPGSKVWIATLMKQPVRGRKKTWVSGTRVWMNRHSPGGADDEGIRGEKNPSRAWYIAVRNTTMARSEKASKALSWVQYQEAKMVMTYDWTKQSLVWPQYGAGMTLLLRCRIGAFWTARRLAQIGVQGLECLQHCPCCNSLSTPETVAHMLVCCPAWEPERKGYLGELMASVRDTAQEPENVKLREAMRPGVGDPIEVMRVLLLGGEMGSWSIPGWCRLPQDKKGKSPARVEASRPSEGNEEDAAVLPCAPGCVRVAAFLQAIQPKRLRVLRETAAAPPPRADASDEVGLDLLLVDRPTPLTPVARHGGF